MTSDEYLLVSIFAHFSIYQYLFVSISIYFVNIYFFSAGMVSISIYQYLLVYICAEYLIVSIFYLLYKLEYLFIFYFCNFRIY